MKCPECDTLYGDNLKGRLHCKECNTHLIIRTDKVSGETVISIETPNVRKIEREIPSKVVRFIPDGGSVKHGEVLCNFCTSPTPKMLSVRGNIITGFDKKVVESTDYPGEQEEKYIPRFKEVLSCTACMHHLNEVLPDKVVNPIEERFKYGRSEIRRQVKDVTSDTTRADDFDTTPCTTYVEFNGKCLYCGGKEVDHTTYVLERTIRLERYNSR